MKYLVLAMLMFSQTSSGQCYEIADFYVTKKHSQTKYEISYKYLNSKETPCGYYHRKLPFKKAILRTVVTEYTMMGKDGWMVVERKGTEKVKFDGFEAEVPVLLESERCQKIIRSK